jgi:hypothetical protein
MFYQMSAFCEVDNEYSSSVTGGEFPDYLSVLPASQEAHHSMQLVMN